MTLFFAWKFKKCCQTLKVLIIGLYQAMPPGQSLAPRQQVSGLGIPYTYPKKIEAIQPLKMQQQ